MKQQIFTLNIIQKYKESPDSYCYTLRITDELKSEFLYIPGQYIIIHLKDKNGVKQSRHYSITNSINSQNITFCVKLVPGGIVSNLLHFEYNIGDTLQVSPPKGKFILNNSILNNYQNLVFVTGGSGITPIKSMINHALINKFDGRIFLIYANRVANSIIFFKHFQNVKQTNCQFIFTIDEPSENWTGEVGQLSIAKIDEIFLKYNIPYDDSIFYTTGPSIIIENTLNHLKDNKVNHTDIKFENFFVASRAENPSSKSQQIKIRLKGLTHNVTVNANQSILDATLKAGYKIDYECKIGNCQSCKAALKSGRVNSINKYQVRSNKILTCTSFPINDQVVVDFDKSLFKSIIKRNYLIIISIFFSFFLLLSLTDESNELYLAKGHMNTGHENLRCVDCHTAANGTIRQQLQNNAKTFLNLIDDEYVEFGKMKVDNNKCLNCHVRPNDVHPTHRFIEPRFVNARMEIHPENCTSCHNEHTGKRLSIDQVDFCKHCHQDIKINNDPLETSHEHLMLTEQWSTCLQCHDFHGNHIYEVPKNLTDTISLQRVKNYFLGGVDPYGEVKRYIVDSIKNQN